VLPSFKKLVRIATTPQRLALRAGVRGARLGIKVTTNVALSPVGRKVAWPALKRSLELSFALPPGTLDMAEQVIRAAGSTPALRQAAAVKLARAKNIPLEALAPLVKDDPDLWTRFLRWLGLE